GCMYLGRLAVLPAYRGTGIGRRLVEAVEMRARTLGIAAMELGVRIQLADNQAFFERMGYRIARAEAHAGFCNPTCYFMEKRLD
ncbi:MAG: GNAT family N-acetyltransferase, partial [Anaerolineae bacterium]|nr:GNAT family N-acetyltransferase [Anaerolineae bacterium]